MTEGLIALAIALPLWVALPFVIARYRRPGRGTRSFGHALETGVAILDPAKARAMHMIEIHKEIGHADEGKDDLPAPLPREAE